jgi:hypothetical protein
VYPTDTERHACIDDDETDDRAPVRVDDANARTRVDDRAHASDNARHHPLSRVIERERQQQREHVIS